MQQTLEKTARWWSRNARCDWSPLIWNGMP